MSKPHDSDGSERDTATGTVPLPEGLRRPYNPADVFPRLVDENPEVCSECFHRVGHREDIPTKAGLKHGDRAAYIEYHLPDGVNEREIFDREYFEHVRDDDRLQDAATPDTTPTAGETNACGLCGAVNFRQSRALPRNTDTATAHAVALSSTLTEYGIGHDPATLVERTRTLKQTPEYAGDDSRVFKKATADAIRERAGETSQI
jgi:hypothetical protein